MGFIPSYGGWQSFAMENVGQSAVIVASTAGLLPRLGAYVPIAGQLANMVPMGAAMFNGAVIGTAFDVYYTGYCSQELTRERLATQAGLGAATALATSGIMLGAGWVMGMNR